MNTEIILNLFFTVGESIVIPTIVQLYSILIMKTNFWTIVHSKNILINSNTYYKINLMIMKCINLRIFVLIEYQ